MWLGHALGIKTLGSHLLSGMTLALFPSEERRTTWKPCRWADREEAVGLERSSGSGMKCRQGGDTGASGDRQHCFITMAKQKGPFGLP